MKLSRKSLFLFLVGSTLIAGCDPLPRRGIGEMEFVPKLVSASPIAEAIAPTQVAVAIPKAKARVTNRKANKDGKIMILEYHAIGRKNTLLDRTVASFRNDLEKLYKLGYRPVTATEWLDDRMELAPGASPVIITFDDARDSQFQFDKEGKITKNCFVGIWKDFAEKHPDFPVHGTFFVLPPYSFGQIHHVADKIKMLQEMGSEIASHTWHHKNLSVQTDETVKREIATSLDWLEQFGVHNPTLAFPYGNKPKNMKLMEGFTYKGKAYSIKASFLAAGEPSAPITDKKFNRWQIRRVVACENEGGSTYWMNVMKKGKKFTPYVAP